MPKSVAILCGMCQHDVEQHPGDGMAGFLAMMKGEATSYEDARDIDWKALLDRPCAVLDCRCEHFTPSPFPEGLYLPSPIHGDGVTVLSWEPTGPRRVCALDRCAIAEDEPRYRISIMPSVDNEPKDEKDSYWSDVDGWWDEWSEELEDDDPRVEMGDPLPGVPLIACERCVFDLASEDLSEVWYSTEEE